MSASHITISRHADQRCRERIGIPRRAIQREAHKAWTNGTLKGVHQSGRMHVAYNWRIWVFLPHPDGEVTLITVKPIFPTEEKFAEVRRNVAEHLDRASRKNRLRQYRKRVMLRSKREDFPTKEAQRKASELTAHCIMQIKDVALNTLGITAQLEAIMREKWGMEHVPHQDYDPELDN